MYRLAKRDLAFQDGPDTRPEPSRCVREDLEVLLDGLDRFVARRAVLELEHAEACLKLARNGDRLWDVRSV